MKEVLRKVFLDIRRGEYLADALRRQGKNGIPNNVILNKTLPGLGATHAELVAERDSIIIEPNVPVIRGKEEKHPHILGVYRGVTIDRIIDYLQKRKHRRKLVTTPEGFTKIKAAMEEVGIDMYGEFFFLFDECEKITQDIDYREAISLPMEDLFKFRKRAFVSATPLAPSDPRFAENGFRELVIRPDYPYRKPLRLITTNNIVLTVADVLKEGRRKAFVFVNSIDTIDSIFRELDDYEHIATYCSQQGLEKLYDRRHRKAHDEIKDLQRINFLTGRFYSAVDIDLNEKPDVVLITDLYGAEQSVIDPYTEAIQIAGRFRGGINSITHITSIRQDLDCMTPAEAETWLQGAERVYTELKGRSRGAMNRGERDMLTEAATVLSYAQYVDGEGRKNHFKTDNLIEHEKVKSLYRSADALRTAYEQVGYFDVSHKDMQYEVDDNDRLILHRLATMKTRREFLLKQFEKLNPLRFAKDEKTRERYRNCVRHLLNGKDDYLFYECFKELGADFIRENGYNSAKIKKAVEQASPHLVNMEADIRNMVRKAFKSGEVHSRADVSVMLGAIYRKVGKPFNKRVNATDLKKYIQVEEVNTTKERAISIC